METLSDIQQPRSLAGVFNELLIRPLTFLDRARNGGQASPFRMIAASTLCYALYGAAAGFFQGGDQILVAAWLLLAAVAVVLAGIDIRVNRLPLPIVAGFLNKNMYSFVTRQNIQKAFDLKGKTIGIASFGAANEFRVLLALKALGGVLSAEELLVVLRLRWQIELLFKLWKEHGHIDEWRSKKPWRILCELYAKLCAMVIQQWLIQVGCWQDPHRSLVKAAQVVRREANRIMVALYEGGLEPVLHGIVRCMQSGCRLNTRKSSPNTSQFVLGTPLVWPKRRTKPKSQAKAKPSVLT